ncbi:MAG: hypothetical protein ACJ71G_03730 [Nitrososphaeraceae archaeon]
MVERCDKCDKPFVDKSEVNRHKMYEHSVPVSPFEQNKEAAVMRKDTGNGNSSRHPEELQKPV